MNLISNLAEFNKSGELKDGTMNDVSVNGRETLLAGASGKYYIAENRCPETAIIIEDDEGSQYY